MDKDKSYFMRRAAQERSAADHASGGPARKAHKELEQRYRQLVGASGTLDGAAHSRTAKQPPM
jgi:hypothetical protein